MEEGAPKPFFLSSVRLTRGTLPCFTVPPTPEIGWRKKKKHNVVETNEFWGSQPDRWNNPTAAELVVACRHQGMGKRFLLLTPLLNPASEVPNKPAQRWLAGHCSMAMEVGKKKTTLHRGNMTRSASFSAEGKRGPGKLIKSVWAKRGGRQ